MKPSSSIRQRMTVEVDGDFCVFLIGARVNNWLKIHKWLPVATAMTAMLKELYANPQLGFLGAESAFGNPSIMVQYWRSFEALESYAKARDRNHLPAWMEFNRKVAESGEVGIWHETYQVKAGAYEAIYHNLPPFGLGRVGRLVPVTPARDSAADRMGK